jgi:hypothetical protein
VFGTWDSRTKQGRTGTKLPRIYSSKVIATTISADNGQNLTIPKYGQYFTTLSNDLRDDLVPDSVRGKQAADDALSAIGFNDCPVKGLGGVVITGDIVRHSQINVRLIRQLRSKDKESTERLQAYALGLALFALTVPTTGYLRQGCNLVSSGKAEYVSISEGGERTVIALSHEEILAFAQEAAKQFSVGKSLKLMFDPKAAKKAVREEIDGGKKAKAAGSVA